MRSYTSGRNLYGVWTKNSSTANLSQGDSIANDTYRKIISLNDWPFLEKKRTLVTDTTQFIPLPYDCDQVREVAIQVSSTLYTPKLSPSREHWDKLNLSTFTSNIPEWYFVFDGKLGLWPTPSTGGNSIYVTQKSRVIDLSIADYTTGTITSVVNGDGTVAGSGTSWTTQMVGRYIKIDYSDTTNTGDGLWYEISTVSSATVLEITRNYGGTTIAAGTATYTIGQMPLLPEAFQDMPWKAAAGDYWSKEADERGPYFNGKYADDLSLLNKAWTVPTTSYVINDGTDQPIINPNLLISL